MTQKELSYVEDAVGHIKSMKKICNYFASNLKSEELKKFIESEINTQKTLEDNLINLLKEEANGQ